MNLARYKYVVQVAATKAAEAAATLKKKAAKAKSEEMHLFAKNPSEESLVGRIKNWTEKIKKLQIDIRDRDDNKEVSLSTSKINYMDPRVSVAWCKRHEVPVEKVFAKTLRDKFVWSMNIPPDWEFSYDTLLNSKQSAVGAPKAKKAATPAKSPKKPAAAAAVKVEITRAKTPPSVKGKAKAAKKEEAESSEEEEEDDDKEDSSSGDEDDDDEEEDSEEGSSSSGEEGSSSDDEEDDDEEEEEDDEEEEEAEAAPPSKKRRSQEAGGGSAPKKARRPTIEDDEENDGEESDGGGDSDFAP